METHLFTTQNGIEIQADQLKNWKRVLKPDVYNKLRDWATKNNKIAKTGNDITRGQILDTFVHALMRNPNAQGIYDY